MRLSRLKRAPIDNLPRLRLTARDRQIIQAVYTYRALTTAQIEALFFSPPDTLSAPSSTRCQYRLKLLYHYGFLERKEQFTSMIEGRKPFVYFLTERGAALIAESMGMTLQQVDWRPSHSQLGHQHLAHLLDTNDVRVAITLATQLHSWMILTWLDDKTLKSHQAKDYVSITGPRGGRQRISIVPDAYLLLDILKPQSGNFFLEIDRRTETVSSREWSRRDWVRRTQAYIAYYQSGAFEKRYNAKNLRILTVTTGEQRLKHMKAAAERAGARDMFWFSTFEQVTDPKKVLTESIWHVAGKERTVSLTA